MRERDSGDAAVFVYEQVRTVKMVYRDTLGESFQGSDRERLAHGGSLGTNANSNLQPRVVARYIRMKSQLAVFGKIDGDGPL